MSRRLPIVPVLALTGLPLVLTACEFTSVVDAFSSATESYAERAAAVNVWGDLFVVQRDGADVTVDVYDNQGSRLYARSLPDLVDVVGMATDPSNGRPTVLGLGDGDSIEWFSLGRYGGVYEHGSLDLSSNGFYSVHEVCDLAFAPDGSMLVTARRSFRHRRRVYWSTSLLELADSRRVTDTAVLSSSTSATTACATLAHDQDEDITWTALPTAGEVRAWDARLSPVDRFSLNGSGDVEDIEAEGGLLAIGRDRGSSHVLELYHDGARVDIIAVDGTTALAADRTGTVPTDCAADGGVLWRIHTDRDRTNLHGHAVCE